jgi:TusA-related sulfurtransferase
MKHSIGNAVITIDLRVSIIPFALLEICNHFKQMQAGDIIEVISMEPGIEKDLHCILPKNQYEIVCVDAPLAQRGARVVRLRKLSEPTGTRQRDGSLHETL